MLPETKYRLDTLSKGSTGFNEPEGPAVVSREYCRSHWTTLLRGHNEIQT